MVFCSWRMLRSTYVFVQRVLAVLCLLFLINVVVRLPYLTLPTRRHVELYTICRLDMTLSRWLTQGTRANVWILAAAVTACRKIELVGFFSVRLSLEFVSWDTLRTPSGTTSDKPQLHVKLVQWPPRSVVSTRSWTSIVVLGMSSPIAISPPLKRLPTLVTV